MAVMSHLPQTELKQIGRDAAQRVFGPGKVKDVEVIDIDASDNQPAYLFSILYEGARDAQQMALLRIRLDQKLRDELLARGDDGYPLISVLSPQDWDKRQVA